MSLTHIQNFLRLLLERFVDTRCPLVAGSLTFTSLLAVVPLLAVALSVFSHFPGFAQFGDSLSAFLLDNLLPETAGRIIATYALEFTQKAGDLTVIGSAVLIITALSLMLTIDSALNTIWGVRTPRPLVTRLTIYWVVLTVGPLFLGGSLAATSYVVSTSLGLVNDPPWLRLIVARMLPVLLLGMLFSFLYYSIPNRRINPWHALVGGVAAALGFIAMQRGLGFYFAYFPSYTLIYGTFATLPIFLLWLYLSWIVILLGAILAAGIPTYLSRIRALPSFPGTRAYGALLMLRELAAAQTTGDSRQAETLYRIARQTPAHGEPILEDMHEAGWLARTDEEDWILARRIDDIRLSDVLTRFCISAPAIDGLAADGLAPETAAHIRAMLSASDLPLPELFRRVGSPAGQSG
ncbi:YihY family inner membrane protein [Nitrogeniibacter aestuarii]|uniref:YihY family inner membrane protein n=1 Tax=Nitrogeniibacter aestuarii TaxID=2815343 RepID=UPI001D10E5EE|nr:YihY family inner membrane protein [Nitrogeniibacter aestuarii]